jgi:hypothetical protein
VDLSTARRSPEAARADEVSEPRQIEEQASPWGLYESLCSSLEPSARRTSNRLYTLNSRRHLRMRLGAVRRTTRTAPTQKSSIYAYQ